MVATWDVEAEIFELLQLFENFFQLSRHTTVIIILKTSYRSKLYNFIQGFVIASICVWAQLGIRVWSDHKAKSPITWALYFS